MTRIPLCSLLVALLSTAASADESPTIVVTATRDARPIASTPYSTSTLSSDELRLNSAVRTVPEALESQPGTLIQKTAQGQGSPYIRGFTSQRNLLMIDGIRLNNAVFREGPNQYWNTVDAFSLSRLEVARGPFSVLYGSDAIGGTVNAITRGVDDMRPDSAWDRRVYYRGASAERSHIGRAELQGLPTEHIGITLGVTKKDFGDVEGGQDVGRQENTGYEETDWDAKLELFLDEDAWLVLAHQSVNIDDAWRTHKTIYGIDWKGLSVGSELRRVLDQERQLTYLQFHDLAPDGFADEIHASLSYHRQSEDRDRLRTRGRWDQQGFDVETLGAQLSLKSETGIGTLIYGAETYRDEVDSYKRTLASDGSTRSTAIQGPVGDDATYQTVGLFLQDEIQVQDDIVSIVGARYEYVEADADTVEDPLTGEPTSISGDWDEVVASLRLRYDGIEGAKVFAGVSQGFRAPNLSDLTRLDSARTDEIETPSPDLDPEHFVSYELGIKGRGEQLSGSAAYFYTDIDGLIVRTPTGRSIDGESEVTKKNAGDGYIHGLELDAALALSEAITLGGTFTWMYGKVDSFPSSDAVKSRDYISRLMPPTGRVRLRWDGGDGLWVEGACTLADDADRLSARDAADTSRIPPGGTPGYAVYDLRAGYTLAEQIALSVAIENLADDDYRIHGSGVNEPGRNFVLAVESTF